MFNHIVMWASLASVFIHVYDMMQMPSRSWMVLEASLAAFFLVIARHFHEKIKKEESES